MSKTIANRIFRKWKVDLVDKDRGWDQLPANFDELFYTLHMNSIDVDIVESIVKEAAAAHMPSQSIAKRTWASMKNKMGKTYEEFLKDWRDSIIVKAEQAFFVYYAVEEPEEPAVKALTKPKPAREFNPHLDRMKQMAMTSKKGT